MNAVLEAHRVSRALILTTGDLPFGVYLIALVSRQAFRWEETKVAKGEQSE